MIVQLRLRRGTTTEWATANPLLGEGEPGVDTTAGILKIGDGTLVWNDLPIFANDPEVITALVAEAEAALTAAEAAAAAAATSAASAAGAVSSETSRATAAEASLQNRANHTGTQSADTLTDGTTNKAFLATERTKLAGIATGATANATDAALRDRSLHTGSQLAATISDITETIQDVAGAAIIGGTNITSTYNDTAGTITLSAAAIGTTVSDLDYATLELALVDVPVGGTLEIHSAWARGTTPFAINKACTVRFVDAGKITVTGATTNGINITSSFVRIENSQIVGPGISFSTGKGINLKATSYTTPYDVITISGGEISNFARAGIDIEHCTNLLIEDVYVHDLGYVGFELLSVNKGMVRRCRAINITQPTGFVNSYGFGVSRDYSVLGNPQSSNVTVEDCLVRDVINWEGIDTHAGQNIRFINNQVYNTKYGIVVIGGKNQSGVNTYGPRNIVVAYNHVESTATDGSHEQGIIINGVAGSGGVSIDPAEGIIVAHNTVVGHGGDYVGDNNAAINANNTKGLVLTGNTVIEPAWRGIGVYDTNLGAVVTDNTVIDVWANTTDDGTTGAFSLRGNYNTVYFNGNAALRGTKSATVVNHRGLYAGAATNSISLGTNYFDTCTTPLADSNNITQHWIRAKKFGVFGNTPIVRPAANATGLVETLTNYGFLASGTTVLGTAAYQPTSTFATAAQGAKADTAVQPADLTGAATYTPASSTWHSLWPGTAGTGSGWSAGYLHLYQMNIPSAMTVDQILFEITAVAATAGSTARFGIYGQIGGLPDITNKITDFGGLTYDTTATNPVGAVTLTFTQVTIPKGFCYMGIVAQTSSPTWRTVANFYNGMILPQIGTPTTSATFHGYTRTGVTGALPTSGAPTLHTQDLPPRIYLHTV